MDYVHWYHSTFAGDSHSVYSWLEQTLVPLNLKQELDYQVAIKVNDTEYINVLQLAIATTKLADFLRFVKSKTLKVDVYIALDRRIKSTILEEIEPTQEVVLAAKTILG